MRLSRESISYILDLQKSKRPRICCFSSESDMDYIRESIISYNGRVVERQEIEKSHEVTELSDAILITIGALDSEEILEVERALAVSSNVSVLLEATEVNISINRRDLVLSLLNRYNIDAIKGTEEEIEELIKAQIDYKSNYYNKKAQVQYRSFAKKNKVILVVSGKNYYITDGYSEFCINNYNKEFIDSLYLKYILDSMIIVGLAVCSKKEEKIQSMLISILAFCKSQALVLDIVKPYFNNDIINKYLINAIVNIKVDDIESICDINYEFTR